MKKLITLIVVLVIGMSLFGCGNNSNYDISKMSTTDIATAMKDNGLPVGKILNYTEKTDPNELLGKPNEYIQKLDFADTRLKDEQKYWDYPFGGTIEVFENAVDAKQRYEYIDTVAHSGPISMYMYLYDNVFIRLEKKLTTKQAKEYEVFFEKLANGEIAKPTIENK